MSPSPENSYQRAEVRAREAESRKSVKFRIPLTDAQKKRIREARADGVQQAELARIYRVNDARIRDICRGREP